MNWMPSWEDIRFLYSLYFICLFFSYKQFQSARWREIAHMAYIDFRTEIQNYELCIMGIRVEKKLFSAKLLLSLSLTHTQKECFYWIAAEDLLFMLMCCIGFYWFVWEKFFDGLWFIDLYFRLIGISILIDILYHNHMAG